MANPKLSVLIPTYNYGCYLGQAIDSVLTQTFSDLEIVVIDDCSKDNTDEVMQTYAANDRRIRFECNPANLGMVANWNYCLGIARGDYIKFLFADDFLVSPKALEILVGILDDNPNVSLVGSSRQIIDKDSQFKDIWSFYDQDIIKSGPEVINTCLFENHNYIGEPAAVMFRKCQAERGFDSRYRQLVDLEMWFHLLEQGEYAYIDEPLCAFRVHNEQQTSKNAAVGADIDDTALLHRHYLQKPYILKKPFSEAYLRYNHFYQIWKSYKKSRVMSKKEALEKISTYGIFRFFGLYPIYKAYKPLRKFVRYLTS